MLVVSDASNRRLQAQVCKKAEAKVEVSLCKKVFEKSLESDKNAHGVFVAHCETATAEVNPSNEIGEITQSL